MILLRLCSNLIFSISILFLLYGTAASKEIAQLNMGVGLFNSKDSNEIKQDHLEPFLHLGLATEIVDGIGVRGHANFYDDQDYRWSSGVSLFYKHELSESSAVIFSGGAETYKGDIRPTVGFGFEKSLSKNVSFFFDNEMRTMDDNNDFLFIAGVSYHFTTNSEKNNTVIEPEPREFKKVETVAQTEQVQLNNSKKSEILDINSEEKSKDKENRCEEDVYHVEEDDWLHKIANKCKLSIVKLLHLNDDIEDYDLIYPEQKIKLK